MTAITFKRPWQPDKRIQVELSIHSNGTCLSTFTITLIQNGDQYVNEHDLVYQAPQPLTIDNLTISVHGVEVMHHTTRTTLASGDTVHWAPGSIILYDANNVYQAAQTPPTPDPTPKEWDAALHTLLQIEHQLTEQVITHQAETKIRNLHD